jgi:hypothetical protein
MTLGRNRKCALIHSTEDFELLPALAGLELKRRQLTQELREVLIEYQQLELEIERRGIAIPWLIPSQPDLGAQVEICLFRQRRRGHRSGIAQIPFTPCNLPFRAVQRRASRFARQLREQEPHGYGPGFSLVAIAWT